MVTGNTEGLTWILKELEDKGIVQYHTDEDFQEAVTMLSSAINEATSEHLFEHSYALQTYLSEVLLNVDAKIASYKLVITTANAQLEETKAELTSAMKEKPPALVKVTDSYIQAKIASNPTVKQFEDLIRQNNYLLALVVALKEHMSRLHFIATGRGAALKEVRTRM